ncbi:MAG: amidohydrolase [Holophagae bacterium]
MKSMVTVAAILSAVAVVLLTSSSCRPAPETGADLLLVNGSVYSLSWGEPSLDGEPAADAPHSEDGWRPDLEAVAVAGGRIVFVGSNADAEAHRGAATRVIDLRGATVVPGLVDSHAHIQELGRMKVEVNLVGVETEREAIERVVRHAAGVAPGDWIVGWGWDEGAWANRYPTAVELSAAFPDNPVALRSLHGFAVWGNEMALARAGIDGDTPEPEGGRILRDDLGRPTGVLIDRATTLLTGAIPETTDEQMRAFVLAGLETMARDGYVAVHQAGADSQFMRAAEALEAEGLLPIRLYAMISLRDERLCRTWIERGPKVDDSKLTVRAVKAYYDAALGSRGARLLEDYSDRPGHRGVSGAGYGFDQELAAQMMRAGFQIGIHAIGDAGNRETLDFLEGVIASDPDARAVRHRVEHAQVVHPDDFARFARLGLIAAMQPPHCVEDRTWAEDRLGPERVRGAYAWRTFRHNGVPLTFSADLAGSDHDIFYGLHAAITRRDKQRQPPDGWHPEEAMTAEEALRGYTSWSAYAAHWEDSTGVIALGCWADLTVMDLDPLEVGDRDPGRLLDGRILATVVGGDMVHEAF